MSVSPAAARLDAVRPFASLSRDDVDYAGGKGANLGELTAAGLPVPAGFVVGAPAYAAYCAETGLRERLAEVLEGLDVEDTAALEAAIPVQELTDPSRSLRQRVGIKEEKNRARSGGGTGIVGAGIAGIPVQR